MRPASCRLRGWRPACASAAAGGERFLATTPKRQLLIFLGAVLENADADERASVLTAMPALPRRIWRTVGQRIYARRMRRLRGRV
jgi:hypothetical protein